MSREETSELQQRTMKRVAARPMPALLIAIAVARGFSTPEQLRRAGAHTVVAELHELL